MKIFDAHNDFLTELNAETRNLYIKNIAKYHKNVRLCAELWTTKLLDPLAEIEKVKRFLPRKNFVFCLEDLGFITWENVTRALEIIIGAKPFSCGLVWNFSNSLGSGVLGKGGITTLGKYVVRRLESANILIDTAHMNRKTFFDFAKITTKPIYNSHTAFDELHPHKRNVTHAQIRQIIKSGGLVCLCFVGKFLTNKTPTADTVAREIVWFVKKYGANNLAIGSDFFGTTDLPSGLKTYCDFDELYKILRREGISGRAISCIFSGNLSRFIG